MGAAKVRIFAICGSTRSNSANLQIIKAIAKEAEAIMEFEIYDQLGLLPHFNPDLDNENIVESVKELRDKIKKADGVLICTPEYVFSLPGALKNAIEWTVSTTVFSEKPVALITASGLGEKAHEALLLIMKTIYAIYTPETQLHIAGARAKLNEKGEITDLLIKEKILSLINAFNELIENLKLGLPVQA